jgi:5-hydroxyisourate hydrolase-like protein (transthyretin family)
MKITNEQAEYLLKLPKKIVQKDMLLDKLIIDQKFPFDARFELVSEKDDEFTFLWEIHQSKKNCIRVSFHQQENDSKTGLLRVDYNSGHKNPEVATEHVPEKFHPFVGKCFSIKEHHIHYHVQGYKSLVWAVPLSIDEFEIKELNDSTDFNVTFANIIKLFAKTVNIETDIKINTLLL